MKPYDKPAKKALLTALSIVGGNAVLAFCVAAFIIPHNILIGGTTGIGIVLSHVFPSHVMGFEISFIRADTFVRF